MTDVTYSQPLHFDELSTVFAQLNPQDVEQFYASYQMWVLQRQIVEVQAQIQSVSQRLAENQRQLQRIHPSAIALATLARLQANGVNDSDLLDRLLERGEAWLDRTMQHLAYCEKFDFIRDNYTEWCEHALEGAYAWIDSVADAQVENYEALTPDEHSIIETPSDASVATHVQTTEEMLLQKLMSDEDEALMLAPTLKSPAITPNATETVHEKYVAQVQEQQVNTYIPSDDDETIQPAILPEEGEDSVGKELPDEEIQKSSETDVEDITNIPETSDATVTSDAIDTSNSSPPEVETSQQSQESISSVPETPTLPTETVDAENQPWTWNALSSSETNIPSNKVLQGAKLSRKRGVLRRLVATIFGGR